VKGQIHIYLSLVVIFIAAFSLFFVFDSLQKLANECKSGAEYRICTELSGFGFSMLIILLIIGGFVMTISGVVYILLSA
jgi:uncharacterized YccA/Bax inhibitor family protein